MWSLLLPMNAPGIAGHLGGECRINEPDAGAVEAGIADHRKLSLQRPLGFIGPPPLHRPERLQDTKLLGHRV
jgi:hypothetical protein